MDDETLIYAEEDWNNREQTGNDKGVEYKSPWTMDTRQSKRGRDKKIHNHFVVDRIVLDKVTESLKGLDEIMISQDIELFEDTETDWSDYRSQPEMEFKREEEQMHEQELKTFRVLEWLYDIPADPKETIMTIQEVDQSSIKYISLDNTESNWIAPDGPLCASESNIRSVDGWFVRVVGVGLTHTKKLIIKKLKLARGTWDWKHREETNQIFTYQIFSLTASL